MSPTWQRTPCPPWCSGGHSEHDHPDDRVHRSTGIAFPVVSRRHDRVDPAARAVRAREYEVGLSRRDGAAETWIYVGAGPDEYLEVASSSCAPLLDALRRAHDALCGVGDVSTG